MSMAAPTNSEEWDLATEELCLNLSPLPSPRCSQLCLTPSPPRPFLPLSNSNYSMVMQYPWSNQSSDNLLQNQQWHEEDMGDSALLQQQQLRHNRSEASDWRPRGGIMKMNNQGFEESNMGFEEESEEMMMNCISFPQSPTDFPPHLPLPSSSNSTAFPNWSDFINRFDQNVITVLSNVGNNRALDWLTKPEQDLLHTFKDKSGVLDMINGLELQHEGLINRQIESVTSYIDNNVNDLDRIIGAVGMMPEQHDVVLFVQYILQENDDEPEEFTLRRMKWFEQHDVDIVDQPVLEMVGSVQQLIQKRGGEVDVIPGGGICTINGLEHSDGQGLLMTTEPSFICQSKFAVRVWLGYGGRWVSEIRFRNRVNCLNISGFTPMDDTTLAYETVLRWSGWMDPTGFPGLFQKANRSKLPLQLPPLAQEKPDEDFGLVHCNASGNDEIEAVGTGSEGTWDCVMAHQAWLNLGKRKTKENNPWEERRKKKTNGVRIAIPLEDILQTKGMCLKDAANHLEVTIAELMSSCREYRIQIWSPRNEHRLIMQPLPDETPTVVDQEVIPQLTSHNVPSDQALMVTVNTNSVVEKEIPLTQFLPIAQQENLDAGFGNDEAEAIGMGGEETGEGVIEEAQLNSGCLKIQGKRKVNTPGGERGNNRTTGVRSEIPKEDILRSKGMHRKDLANHLGDFGNVEAEAVGMGSEGIGQTNIEEVQLNSRYLEKEKGKEMTPGGERRNKKDAISLEDILRYKEMPQKVAAKHLNVSLSTLKRACRGHDIPSWPPCGEHNQSRPNEFSAVVNKESIPQLNSNTLLPSNQASATIGTESVTVKARFSTVMMKFQLSWPWRMVELKQEVEKRLGHEAENYYICYKDQDNDDILIACDEDLQDHISRSTLPGTNSIEVFLKPK